MKHGIRRNSKERGFIVVGYAVMMLVIVGLTGMAIDVGYLQYQKRRTQDAADAAALGALRELERGQTDLTAAGQNDASLNGFVNGQGNTTVTINNPPTSGSYANNASAVEAIVQRRIPTFFMMVFGQNSVTLSARAVARTTSTEGSIGGCIFALNPTVANALWISGNMTATTACSVVVKSTNSSAFVMDGNSTLSLAHGAKVGVVGTGNGGWSIGGSSVLDSTTGEAELPVNVQPFNDPLAAVAAPTPSGLSVRSNNQWSDNPHDNNTLNPGVYCGGMNLKGTVTLNAGTYVLAGGGLSINSQATVSGAGISFYNTSSNSAAWGCGGSIAAASLTFNGGATINLAAPTNQSPIGVLFFDDRSVSGLSHTINGNSSSSFNGALYFKQNALTFAGTSNASHGYLVIVADTIKMTGNSNLGNDYEDLENVYTIAPAATGGGLVE